MYRDSPFGRCVHQEAEAEAEFLYPTILILTLNLTLIKMVGYSTT